MVGTARKIFVQFYENNLPVNVNYDRRKSTFFTLLKKVEFLFIFRNIDIFTRKFANLNFRYYYMHTRIYNISVSIDQEIVKIFLF